MKNFPALQPATLKALESIEHLLDDPEETAWRHGPKVDYRVSNIVRHVVVYGVGGAAQTAFEKVCTAAGQCRDQSFFQQVAHCFGKENIGHQPDRDISDRAVTLAYQNAQRQLRSKSEKNGSIVISLLVPSASSVAKEIERLTEKTTTPADARDACARLALQLPLQTHDRVGRPKKDPGK